MSENLSEREIITDIDSLGGFSDVIDPTKESKLVQGTIIRLKQLIRDNNLTYLTAPQIGVDKQIVVMNFNGDLRSFVNPIITKAEGLTLVREHCASIPDKEYIRPRNTKVTLAYTTPLGKVESRQFIGMAATICQHCIDHLNGVLLCDIGLEIDKDFDNATDEEREEVIKAYMDSLDIKRKEIMKEIEEDETLKQTYDAVDFMNKVRTGEVKIVSDEELSKKK